MTDIPYVFILDWDGTICGDVRFQAQYASIVHTLKKYKIKPNVQYSIPPAFGQHSKLIRPGFGEWVKAMQEMYKEVYFFIYTASEKSWANQEIAWVEKLHHIRFARPIFTRDDCYTDSSNGNNSTRKSLGKIFPRVITSIVRERGSKSPLSMTQRKAILENHLVVIDNNAVYNDRADKLLLCPDYSYTVFENLLSLIPKDVRKEPLVQQLIYGLINTGYICKLPDEKEDGMSALSNQYAWLASKCKSLHDQNKAFAHDDFWKFLRKIIVTNKIYTFTPSIIKQLQDASWKHNKSIRESK
jgi:hypothetical protein